MRWAIAGAAVTGLALAAATAALVAQSQTARASDAPARAGATTGFSFEFPGIDGAPLPLEQFAGGPLLVTNTASRCGFTYQYDGLQELWDRYRDRGLTVIGAPSDDFNQELDSAAEVKAYCELNFGITFPMTDIVKVKGQGAHPFFAWAAERSQAPNWNFNKYLVAADGTLVRRYPPTTPPERIAADIEALFATR
ncbi:MAG: glutathione peroxidase [Pseudomonadota bacterium]